jgi:hypothetical protein
MKKVLRSLDFSNQIVLFFFLYIGSIRSLIESIFYLPESRVTCTLLSVIEVFHFVLHVMFVVNIKLIYVIIV